jgi:hypothetical protein
MTGSRGRRADDHASAAEVPGVVRFRQGIGARPSRAEVRSRASITLMDPHEGGHLEAVSDGNRRERPLRSPAEVSTAWTSPGLECRIHAMRYSAIACGALWRSPGSSAGLARAVGASRLCATCAHELSFRTPERRLAVGRALISRLAVQAVRRPVRFRRRARLRRSVQGLAHIGWRLAEPGRRSGAAIRPLRGGPDAPSTQQHR